MRRSSFLAPVLFALSGASWLLPTNQPYGAFFSLLLPVGVALADGPRWRFLSALAYFAAGGSILPAEVQSFFGSGWLVGVGLWAVSSVALAAPWAWASSGVRSVAVVVVEALPPMGFFGWMSPLTAAGLFFPGWGAIGLLPLLALIWTAATIASPRTGNRALETAMLAVVMLCGASLLANAVYEAPSAPVGWIGVNTRVGRETDDVLAEVVRNQRWIDQAAAAVAQREKAGAKKSLVVVLPEDVAGTWGPGTAAQVRAAMRPGDVWLVGASARSADRPWDGQYLDAVVGLGQRGDALLFASPVPVPGGMWRPWNWSKSYTASHAWEPAQTIAGVRAWASICYDQLLAWPWLQAVVQRPAVVLRVSNYWYEPAGAAVPRVASATTAAWARLMGAAVVTAVNRD